MSQDTLLLKKAYGSGYVKRIDLPSGNSFVLVGDMICTYTGSQEDIAYLKSSKDVEIIKKLKRGVNNVEEKEEKGVD